MRGAGDDEMFASAGLWDRWPDPHGEQIESCTIITTIPNVYHTAIHDRIAVILPFGA
jgi:putative SOS response-associated peptidase YedK